MVNWLGCFRTCNEAEHTASWPGVCGEGRPMMLWKLGDTHTHIHRKKKREREGEVEGGKDGGRKRGREGGRDD